MQTKTVFSSLPLIFSCCFFALPGVSAQAEKKERHVLFSVFNAATQLPVGHFFSSPVHPGAVAGIEFRHNRRPKNQWFQTAKIGFSHHRYVQSSIQIFSETGYRRAIWRGTSAELRLGGGYLHAIPATEIFVLKNKNYDQKANLGRPQAMAGGAFGLSFSPKKWAKPWRFSLDYQFYLQLPFVKQYVPLLPNTFVPHLGVAAPFSLFKKG